MEKARQRETGKYVKILETAEHEKKEGEKDAAGVEETPTPMEVQEKPVKASCTYATQTEKEKEIKN